MNKCKKCGVSIVNDEIACPLCSSVLERDEEMLQKEAMYPLVTLDSKGFRMITRIFFLSSILLLALLFLINHVTFNGIWWAAICAGGMFYAFFSLRSILTANTSHIMKIFLQSIGGVLLTVLIDHSIGYSGWSVNYAIPTAVIVLEFLIVILMIVNRDNWQSYLLFQIFLIIVGVVMLILSFNKIVQHPVLNIISVFISLAIFVGSITLGDKKAENELKRRFHF